MKLCPHCKEHKSEREFSRNRSKKDGLMSWCKSCMKEICSEIRQRPHYKKIQAVAARRSIEKPEQRAKHRLRAIKQREMRPDQILAYAKVREAIRIGKLIRMSCEVCGISKTHAHHSDYSKPMEINWLCNEHHRILHLHYENK